LFWVVFFAVVGTVFSATAARIDTTAAMTFSQFAIIPSNFTYTAQLPNTF
jgi:hypothetical protein